MRKLWLIAYSVLIEAVRRKEVYVIVLMATVLIGAVMTVDFFGLEGITKFYLEIALKVMSTAAALTVLVLGARQLPREFENRTIYPLLAKPVSRLTFLTGKLLGVMLAGAFTLALLMSIYVAGAYYLGSTPPFANLFQFVYLQMLALLILACLAFLLSLVTNLDAAITFGLLFYAASAVITNILSMVEIYSTTSTFGQGVILVMNYIIPQLSLLDFSERTVHEWPPMAISTMAVLTGYALFFAGIYFAGAWYAFRRRAI